MRTHPTPKPRVHRTEPFIQLGWRRAVDGYKYEEIGGRHWLVPRKPHGLLVAAAPMWEGKDLFLQLAATDPDDAEAIVALAGRWGLLRNVDRIARLRKSEPDDGEQLQDWKVEIRALRFVVDLWTAVERRDRRALDRSIALSSKGVVSWKSGDSRGGMDAPGYVTDIVAAGRLVAQHLVNKRLQHSSPKLLYSQRQGALRLHVVPADLATLVWLQMAQAMEGGSEHRRCERCGKSFMVSSRDRREARRRFCDTPCRVAWNRRTASVRTTSTARLKRKPRG